MYVYESLQFEYLQKVVWAYEYGSHYAWMLSVFSITMVYSIPCPLITPFGICYVNFKYCRRLFASISCLDCENFIHVGLIYLILKHMVDRYNIYFAYNPSKIDRAIHYSAVNFVIVAGFLLQLFVLFFAYLRSSTRRKVAMTTSNAVEF